ncbi:MAG: hypothetical protein J1E97_07885 [Muribaculaceae bacterium]|nr:hypothetical protein [Muribaculaceae bacterium]
MKRYLILASIALVSLAAFAKSEKRGVSENSFSTKESLKAVVPGITWFYNWGPSVGYGMDGVDEVEDIEFVPMCWTASYNADAIRQWCKNHPNTKYLLGFNEPNFKDQANLTPQQAADAWPGVQALAKELGLKLVAPALNYSPYPPYTDPLKWMDEFVALVGKDAFDYVAVHNYGGLGVMKTIAGNFHDRYGKDVWVTEFCFWPGEGSTAKVTPQQQILSMVESVEWLETTPWIFRYAWFKAYGKYDAETGPNYGLIKQEGKITDPWGLSEQGYVYLYMSDFDTSKWLKVEDTHPAANYVESNGVQLGSTQDANCGSAIEINKFNGGSWATWQFEIPQSGDYDLALTVSGYGEPKRYDPVLQWVLVDGDTETPLTDAVTPQLPNSDTEYSQLAMRATLPAGNVKLRLKDANPGRPSGIKISAVKVTAAAGVETLLGDSDRLPGGVYNLQGIRVADSLEGATLPAGIYIHNGKKIILH